jgi:hypothetical protein
MAKRKPRKAYRPRGHGRTLREVLEMKVAELLVERSVRALKDAVDTVDVDTVVARAAAHLGDADTEGNIEYAQVWEVRIATLIDACADLTTLVHRFLDRYSLYLLGAPSEVANAVWAATLHAEVTEVVDRVIHARDVNGEQRYIFLGDGQIERNPNFVEPDV